FYLGGRFGCFAHGLFLNLRGGDVAPSRPRREGPSQSSHAVVAQDAVDTRADFSPAGHLISPFMKLPHHAIRNPIRGRLQYESERFSRKRNSITILVARV